MTPHQLRLRSLLTNAAKDLGIPEGYAPAQDKFRLWAREHGYPTDYQLIRRTPGQTWVALVRYAGMRHARDLWMPGRRTVKPPLPPMDRKTLRAEMIGDLRRVAREIGRPDRIPAPKTYRALGNFHERDLLRVLAGDERGGSWHDVAASANLLGNRARNGYWTEDKVLSEYRRIAKKLGRKPGGPGLTAREIKKHIAPSRSLSEIGTPNQIAEKCGYAAWPSGFRRLAA